MRAAVLTISTTRARGEGEDVSGAALVDLCRAAGLDTVHHVLPDDREAIAAALRRLADEDGVRFIFTTGGTGMTADDVTPEATRDVIDRDAPGYAETIRAESCAATANGWRSTASRLPSNPARRSGSSGRTARARRHCCACWPHCCARTP